MSDKISKNSLLSLATGLAIFISVLLVLGKAVGFYFTGSLSVKASFIDSILDSLASLINFFAVRHALHPADEDHRFGHGKIEALASLAQSCFIVISAFWLLKDIGYRLFFPEVLIFNTWAIAIMALATILTIFLVIFQHYVIKKTQSLAIKADSLHYETDLLSNIGVLITLYFSSYWIYLDAFIGAFIAVYILKSSWNIGKRAFDILMDKELSFEISQKIKEIVLSHPMALDLHELKTRSSGSLDFFQMHIAMDKNLSLQQSHAVAEEIEFALKKEFPDTEIIIHQDPV